VEGRFNAGQITSNAGGLLLGEVAGKMSFFDRTWRTVLPITGTPNELNTASKRCWPSAGTGGIALGYEDLHGHDDLRADALLAILAGKDDPSGQDRGRERDDGKPLAGQSTLGGLAWPEVKRLGEAIRREKGSEIDLILRTDSGCTCERPRGVV
jgi:hypothetical protein